MLHFYPDLTVVKVENSKRSQVLSGIEQQYREPDFCFTAPLAMDRMYVFDLKLLLSLRPSRRSGHGAHPAGTFVDHDR